MMQFGRHFDKIEPFIDALRQNDIGGATTDTLSEIFQQHAPTLQAELYVVLDIGPTTRYARRLEIFGIIRHKVRTSLQHNGGIMCRNAFRHNVQNCRHLAGSPTHDHKNANALARKPHCLHTRCGRGPVPTHVSFRNSRV